MMEHGLLEQATPPIERLHPPKAASHPTRDSRWEASVATLQRKIVLYGAFMILFILSGLGCLILSANTGPAAANALNPGGTIGEADRSHAEMPAAHSPEGAEERRAEAPWPVSVQSGLVAAGVMLSASILLAMIYMLHRVIRPLRELGRAVYRMSQGQLNEPVQVAKLKDIDVMGDMVNDMATELQEMLLHVWNHTSQDIALLDRISDALGCDRSGNRLAPEIRKDFDFVRQDIQDMRAMVKAFDFYHVQIMNEKLVGTTHPQA